jgi:thiol:disulfide interchange protein DsbD
MKQILRKALAGLFAFFVIAAMTSPSIGAPVRVEAVEVELVARELAAVAGETSLLGLRIRHDPHWHSYWRNPGDSGLPTRLDLDLPPGVSAGPLQWPAPERLFIPPLANYGYEGEIVLPFSLTVPPGARSPLRIRAQASWLMCRDVCIPGEAELQVVVPVIDPGRRSDRSRHAGLFDRALSRMPSGPIEASVWAEGDRLSIGLPERLERNGQGLAPAGLQFFPYHESALVHAASQGVFALEDSGSPLKLRLEVQLSADGQKLVAQGADALVQAALGIVVSGERVLELAPVASATRLSGGRELARVAGAPAPASAGPSSGRLGLAGSAGTARPGVTGGLLEGAIRGAPATGQGSAFGGALPVSGSGLALSVLFALIGGLILNLMPCVFPVVGLKVLSFAAPGHSPMRSALAFAAGVVMSFWALAAVLLALRTAGVAAGWGFQLQSPVFVAAMALLFVAIGLNFAGLFEVGVGLTRLARFEGPAPPGTRSSNLSNFASGALAVVVATPCTAPFMGSALGFALTASLPETLAVFSALGLGMSLPYLLLGAFPGWLRYLPRPGRWMESLRQFLAFPMFATVGWLAWVLGQQAGIDSVLGLVIGAVLLALAAWVYGRFIQQAGAWRPLPLACALAALLAALWIAWPADEPESVPGGTVSANPDRAGLAGTAADWEPWSAARVAELLAAGRPVFVDFTAAWCVTCQVNKKAVLDRDPVVRAMQAAGVVRLRADWTRRDAAITTELARWGRSGVPLYLYFSAPGRPPMVLPELLTEEIVLAALRQGRAVSR